MSGARATRHSIAIGAAALIVLATAVGSVQAASPGPVPLDQLRPARHAWDLPAAEDPGRLIVTFQPGTSTRSRRAAIGGVICIPPSAWRNRSCGVRRRRARGRASTSTLPPARACRRTFGRRSYAACCASERRSSRRAFALPLCTLDRDIEHRTLGACTIVVPRALGDSGVVRAGRLRSAALTGTRGAGK